MVNFLEFLWAVSAICVIVTLVNAFRRRRRAATRWGMAALAGIVFCIVLELSLPAG